MQIAQRFMAHIHAPVAAGEAIAHSARPHARRHARPSPLGATALPYVAARQPAVRVCAQVLARIFIYIH